MTVGRAWLLAVVLVLAGCDGDDAHEPGPDAGCGGADLTSDPANCGGCGQACQDEERCDEGVCTCYGHECPDGFACCAGSCHSLADDEEHCGACDHACAATEVCDRGECG